MPCFCGAESRTDTDTDVCDNWPICEAETVCPEYAADGSCIHSDCATRYGF